MSATIQNQANGVDGNSQFNAEEFHIRQILSGVFTITPCKVISSTSSGSLALAGTVTVQPLVNAIDGAGTGFPHGPIANATYLRIQGGANAIIMDPAAGDLGVLLTCCRDISVVARTKAQANPGSFRQFDLSDSIYFGGWQNGIPSQYARWGADGITIVSPIAVNIMAPVTTITGSLVVTGDATISGRDFLLHEHSGVQSGSSDTGPVV